MTTEVRVIANSHKIKITRQEKIGEEWCQMNYAIVEPNETKIEHVWDGHRIILEEIV